MSLIYIEGYVEDLADKVAYRCDACGKEATYLSDAWSEITVIGVDPHTNELLHHCLECRSDKKEWSPDGDVQ